MDLDSVFHFQGWDIRYAIVSSAKTSTSGATQAKNIVFVHGTPWSSVVYRPIIESLVACKTYRVLVYDLPGYGKSQSLRESPKAESGFQGDTSVKLQAQALAELLKHVKLDGKDGNARPAVIAHDIAGTIVLRAHLLHGCEFNSMLLADANTVLPWGDGFYKLARSDSKTFLQLPPHIYEAVLRAVIQSACYNPNVLKSGWEDSLAQPWIDQSSSAADSCPRQSSFIRQIAQANDEHVKEMLTQNLYERVRCDVKIIWGEQDQWIPKEKIETLISKLGVRAKEYAYIPNAGHLVMLDQPERFAIEVFDWLSKSG